MKQGGPHGGMRWGQEQEEMVEKWGLLSNERGSVGGAEAGQIPYNLVQHLSTSGGGAGPSTLPLFPFHLRSVSPLSSRELLFSTSASSSSFSTLVI